MTESFKIILDERPEDIKEKVKERFNEISKSITDFPLHVEKSFVRRTEEPEPPKGFIEFIKDFLKKKKERLKK